MGLELFEQMISSVLEAVEELRKSNMSAVYQRALIRPKGKMATYRIYPWFELMVLRYLVSLVEGYEK